MSYISSSGTIDARERSSIYYSATEKNVVMYRVGTGDTIHNDNETG